MATVRDTDLPDLLISLGYQVKRIGRYYTTQEMDSIRIKDRRTWFRYSEGIGGDAITFLQRFYNKSFPEAVEYLLTWHGRARDSPPASTPRQTKEKEEKFPFNTFDAVITDPPYASGGRTQAEKNKSTDKKYSSMGESAPPPFDGDSKDQRSWTRWAAEWLYDARKVCKPGAPVCMFIDWRQLPAATDALQWAGWIWRGTAVWDKGNSRPQKGRFRQQAEYIVWGSNGDMPISRPVPCLPGVFKYGNPQNRIHLTEKPLQLMRDVVKITEPGGRILDPFAGSGSTVLAAVLEGYSATGIEVTDAYAALSKERIVRELAQSA